MSRHPQRKLKDLSISELNKLDNMTATTAELNTAYLTVYIGDISTAGSGYIVSPVAGTITAINSVINGAIATADAALTPKIGGTNITGGAITVANSGSAAGDIDTAAPSAANVLAVGDLLEVATDGASTNTVACAITFTITL